MKILLFSAFGGEKTKFDISLLKYCARIFMKDNGKFYEHSQTAGERGFIEINKGVIDYWLDSDKNSILEIELKELPKQITRKSLLRQILLEHPEWLI